jgi:RNA polymerase sigma factor (sigma-70 family)
LPWAGIINQMPDPLDMDLVREFARGHSEAAFTELVQRHLPLVYSVALRYTGNDRDAQDVAQAVFIILARKAGSLRDKTLLPGWLYETTRFTAARLLRGNMRRRAREQEAYMQSTLNETGTGDAWKQLAPYLESAMARLKERDRALLVLRFYQNKTGSETAALMGIRENTLHKRVTRALEKLRMVLAKSGVMLSGQEVAGAISSSSIQAVPAALAKSITAAGLAKGAAASASTLTLAKGASTLMAWSKAKTVAITSAALLFAAGGVSYVTIKAVHAIRESWYPNIAGTWEGVAHISESGIKTGDAAKSRVILTIFKTNGVYRATADWPDMGIKDDPMADVVYDYPNLVFTHNVLRHEIWNLTVNAAATEMVWSNFINFIEPDPVLFTRTITPDPVPDPLAESDFAPATGSDLQGYWEGEVGTGTNAVPIDLKIARQTDGTYRAEGDSPMQGIQGRPVLVSYNSPLVKIAPADGAGTFSGQLNDSGTAISGSWTQDGLSSPAVIERADYQAQHAHDADKDYSFTSQEDLQGHWKGTWTVTIGTTTVQIRYVLDIAKLPDGSYSATLTSPDQFGAKAPAPTSDFQYSSPHLHLEWKWIGGAFDGRLEKGRIVGTWSESGGGWPLVFEREN